MAKKAQKSLLQDKADLLRTLKDRVDEWKAIESSLETDVRRLEIELGHAKSNLADTISLRQAVQDKMIREANSMHTFIEVAIGDECKPDRNPF